MEQIKVPPHVSHLIIAESPILYGPSFIRTSCPLMSNIFGFSGGTLKGIIFSQAWGPFCPSYLLPWGPLLIFVLEPCKNLLDTCSSQRLLPWCSQEQDEVALHAPWRKPSQQWYEHQTNVELQSRTCLLSQTWKFLFSMLLFYIRKLFTYWYSCL